MHSIRTLTVSRDRQKPGLQHREADLHAEDEERGDQHPDRVERVDDVAGLDRRVERLGRLATSSAARAVPLSRSGRTGTSRIRNISTSRAPMPIILPFRSSRPKRRHSGSRRRTASRETFSGRERFVPSCTIALMSKHLGKRSSSKRVPTDGPETHEGEDRPGGSRPSEGTTRKMASRLLASRIGLVDIGAEVRPSARVAAHSNGPRRGVSHRIDPWRPARKASHAPSARWLPPLHTKLLTRNDLGKGLFRHETHQYSVTVSICGILRPPVPKNRAELDPCGPHPAREPSSPCLAKRRILPAATRWHNNEERIARSRCSFHARGIAATQGGSGPAMPRRPLLLSLGS